MATNTLDDFVCIPLSSELYQTLSKRFPDRISTVLENITWDYLERTEEDFVAPPIGGIIWNRLQLPNGTQLRVKKSHSNDYGYGEIKKDKLMYLDEEVGSPSQFARKVKNNTSVNAWLYIDVKRPQDRDWKPANDFR
jgi:hypothetical protein